MSDLNPESSPPDAFNVTDEDIHRLVDGSLPRAEAWALEARVAMNPQTKAKLDAWRGQRAALKQLHRDLLNEPVPESMAQRARELAAGVAQRQQWGRFAGRAAVVLLAFTAGWAGRSVLPIGPGTTLSTVAQARDFAHQAALAHAVFLPEVRHPVEVAAAEQAHLVQWLSKRVGRALTVPVLSDQGYQLMGGRLLPGDTAAARAQFMYQDTGGQRITLYLGALGKAESAREIAFRFADKDGIPTFYWVDQGFGYALAGQLSRAELLRLATSVHDQLMVPARTGRASLS